MATFTLTAVDVFPAGTAVSVYRKRTWVVPTGPPNDATVATATMTATGGTFTGLVDGTDYWAAAQVAGKWVWRAFTTAPVVPTGFADVTASVGEGLLKKIQMAQEDVTILVISDSTGNDPGEWPDLTARWLVSADGPAPKHGMTYWQYVSADDAWPGSPTVIRTADANPDTGGSYPTITWWNAGVGGTDETYFVGERAARILAPTSPVDYIFINLGHNDAADIGRAEDGIRLLIETWRALCPRAGVCLMTQNPESPPATNWAAQDARMGRWVQVASKASTDLIDVHAAVVAIYGARPPADGQVMLVDGVHGTKAVHAAAYLPLTKKALTPQPGNLTRPQPKSQLLLPGNPIFSADLQDLPALGSASYLLTLNPGTTGGTWGLTWGGQSTASAFSVSAGVGWQANVEALSSVGAGNVQVSGHNGGPWTLTFTGTLAGAAQAAPTIINNLTGGGSPGITVTSLTTGGVSPGSIFPPGWTGITSAATPAFSRDLTRTVGVKADGTTKKWGWNMKPAGGAVGQLGAQWSLSAAQVAMYAGRDLFVIGLCTAPAGNRISAGQVKLSDGITSAASRTPTFSYGTKPFFLGTRFKPSSAATSIQLQIFADQGSGGPPGGDADVTWHGVAVYADSAPNWPWPF